jgi:hypothetical protein
MADTSLFETYFNQRRLNNPAFNYERGKGFVPSGDTKQIINKFKEVTGKDLDIRPANSVMVDNNGIPFWGGGGGVAPWSEKNVGYIDPLMGNAHVVAHEGAHALMSSPAYQRGALQGTFNMDPLEVPRNTGQRLRYVHETLAKPWMEEEANAQGVAYGLLNKLGIPNDEGWENPTAYPKTFLEKGAGKYGKTEIGPPSSGELKEMNTIMRSADPFLERMFKRGYNLIK